MTAKDGPRGGGTIRCRRGVSVLRLRPILFVAFLAPVWCVPDLAAQAAPPATETTAALRSNANAGLRQFLPDLTRNTVRLWSVENLLPLAIGVAGVGASHPADRPLNDYFGRSDRLGDLADAGNNAGNALVVASAVGSVLAVGQMQQPGRFRRFSYELAQSAALTGLITSGMKAAVGRRRPTGDSERSFPSGHASSAFAVATVVAKHYGLRAAIPGYLGAAVVAVSRLDAGQHYLSDVVAGATVGYIVGRTVVEGGNRQDGRLSWLPLISPRTATIGLVVALRVSE